MFAKSLPAALLLSIACTSTGPARAEAPRPASFPSSPITIVVPFGPGSGSDVYARYFGEKLSKRLKQPVVIENKPGGGGTVAALSIMSQPANGLSILLGSNSPMAVNVSTYKKLRYDPVKQFIPLSGLTRSMAVLIVPKDSPIKNINDLVSRGKSTPRLNMGTYSTGYQLGVAGFAKEAGINWQDVPYKGLSQTTTDVIGKQLDLAVIDTPGTTRIINGGQVKAVAVTGDKRHPELPDVPTLKESGYSDAIHYSWTALWLKAGTPTETVQYLSDNMQAVLSEPSSATFVSNNSGEIMDLQPDQLRQFQLQEIKRFEKAATQTNFTKL
ncbi:MAG TPA: tripartite tricarboxylate transporter substrate binding protein [Advenella kashmirensis]|uniref:Tripartite tricarboxylate transporter substrate binding protein n=1 Tax=Advenella kashmirensis TaxID=310575 RepID=A0A356LG54_9BURK|nr:tripartite tricarboxylate transporter substrate binding protein [Advenella kashmirensis]